MAKFPSQRKIMYAGAAVSNGVFAQTHLVSLPKDLSILNRRGYASTNRKGVPLVFRVAATVFPSGIDGSGYTTTVASDITTTVKFLGCQNNWVMKNAAVKWHAARDAMWKAAGINRKHLGAYAKDGIRYNWNSNATSWSVPVDGAGAAFAGGTWDVSNFAGFDDSDFTLRLTGIGLDEDTDSSVSTGYNIGHSYLGSRATVPVDSNLESSLVPADESVLVKMLAYGGISSPSRIDDIKDDVQDGQDNPPYDEFVSSDLNHDITETVELGRMNMFPQGSGGSLPQTVILDVPFGIMEVQMSHRDPGDNSGITDDLALGLEVLDIFEMQG